MDGERTRILSTKISKREKKEIIEGLLRSEKVQVGESIDYLRFQELYQIYAKQMSEQKFAELLDISYSNFINMKNKRM